MGVILCIMTKDEELNRKVGIHPITSATREFVQIFKEMGFTVGFGPEIETEHYNFDALNVPKDHPARDMQDTFWFPDGRVLRTHCTSVTSRHLDNGELPIREISIGRTYRNEATDMTHEAQFHQIDCLVAGEDITMANLKWTLNTWLSKYFGSDGSSEIRFRPNFFPFVEPGIEVDMRLTGEDAPEKLRGKWIELGGAGMLHPNVFKTAGLDPKKYRGFAFGFGVERLAMLKHAIDDIRLFHNGDLRFINQFKADK